MKHVLVGIALVLLCATFPWNSYGVPLLQSSPLSPAGKRTVTGVIKQLGPVAEARMKQFFVRADIPYPPQRITFVVLKEEAELEVWTEKKGKWVHLHTYDVLGSGGQGPKQRRGDRQVPEGIYRIVELNPSSRFHLSMKLDYPNSFDLQKARDDKRSNLGGDIYIHGKVKSCGCLAVGDRAIEELFVLVAKAGANNVKVIIAPHDMRKGSPALYSSSQPAWLPELYETIGQELTKYTGKQGA